MSIEASQSIYFIFFFLDSEFSVSPPAPNEFNCLLMLPSHVSSHVPAQRVSVSRGCILCLFVVLFALLFLFQVRLGLDCKEKGNTQLAASVARGGEMSSALLYWTMF